MKIKNHESGFDLISIQIATFIYSKRARKTLVVTFHISTFKSHLIKNDRETYQSAFICDHFSYFTYLKDPQQGTNFNYRIHFRRLMIILF